MSGSKRKMTNSRKTVTGFLFLACLLLAGNLLADAAKTYRIGLTAVILTDQTSFLKEWQDYLSDRLQHPVQFVQRQTYQEVTELLLSGDLDAAWTCGYPYVRHRDQLKLLGVPLFNGAPLYRSYLIVPATDTSTRAITDLKRKVFAYSDPDSNSGFLYPQVSLIREGIEPRHFFSKSFFTWAHRDVVKAVADGVAQGGAVDGYVWETLSRHEPALTAGTRLVSQSPLFGFPPLVVRKDIPPQHFYALKNALLKMSSDTEGRRLLQRLNLDGFSEGEDALFDGVAESVRILDGIE
ncbi:PhnD/SsuA/transferrin family substrate-binding protein [Sedimenticola hydrogenitrophicus]|uniref:substrate-binding domain-containing protein n=1 Tax=Sedimenticola hydrogenitrophicus TaxID=2967975 RepID=UPI0021A27F21|nr:PhnD/SsuA/transferrin family substrate-binding protein [Sedimenticola hydrogenitrophicus]